MKPRCDECSRATKNIYQRIGTKGSWNPINSWMYCPNCNRMKKLERYHISEDVKQYIDDFAGKKFPKIARIRDEINAEYVDMDELRVSIEQNQINYNPTFIKQKHRNFIF